MGEMKKGIGMNLKKGGLGRRKVKLRVVEEVSGAHKLDLDYESKCKRLHGHNWSVMVVLECNELNLDKNGMVVDFSFVREIIRQLDHRDIGEVIGKNATCENVALWIWDKVEEGLIKRGRKGVKVDYVAVQEAKGSIVEVYEE